MISTVENTDQELTGQEDITLLYGILANESVHNAYKEGTYVYTYKYRCV